MGGGKERGGGEEVRRGGGRPDIMQTTYSTHKYIPNLQKSHCLRSSAVPSYQGSNRAVSYPDLSPRRKEGYKIDELPNPFHEGEESGAL